MVREDFEKKHLLITEFGIIPLISNITLVITWIS